MAAKTIQDVYEAVLENHGDVKVLITKMENFEKRLDKHENDDKEEHALFHKRISNNKIIGGVFSIITFAIGLITGSKAQ